MQPVPEPEPELDSDSRYSQRVEDQHMSSRESDYLGLINAVADIDIRDLGVGGGQAIDWPQICVVGGQSDGKSTLLSAVVSAKLSCQLDFLPEGKNRMVTRCPIVVQMLSPEGQFTHIAKVYNGENEAVPGAGQSEVECGGGADPSADDLKAWGTAIKAKIDANQDLNEPTGKNVTAKKVIVRLTGPRMQNLSLVDLPGLRQVDEPSNRGLKDKVEKLVKASVTSNSSIVLAVVRAEQDKANWVGLGVARDVDPHEDRTIAVVTKVDRIFKTEVPDETDRGNREQINRLMGEDGNIAYYAAYNPPEGDATQLPQCFAQQVAEAFPEGHVGNEAIAAGLTEKLTDLLGNQLPALHKKFEARAMALRQELKVPFQPSWEMVEHVALLYGMFVETYALGKIPEGALCSYTDFFDDDGELFPSALKRIINEFKQQNEPQKVYSAPGAQRTILCMDTEAARKQVLSCECFAVVQT
jgi:GTP-binding protein EngB required for normal cell division